MSFFSSLVGGFGSDDAAQRYDEAAKKWDELQILSPEEEARRAKALYDSGLLSPDEYQAVLQQPSSLETATTDPRLREAQMRSLDYLTKVGTEGGMTAEDRAQLNAIQQQNLTAARGAREATAQRLAARGMGGSGMAAVQNMIADQGAATANYLGGTDVAANAQKRALDAMTGAGNLAGNIRTQEFGEAEKKAAAADAIKKFNAANQNEAMAANVQARNAARNKALEMYDTNWQRQKQKTAGWADAYTGGAKYNALAGQQYGQAADTGANFLWNAAISDRSVKEDVAPAKPDLEEFLSKLSPVKWDYKNPAKYGAGTHYGVMAQDMEKSPVGRQFVSKDPEGVRRIDYGKAQGTMLAIIKDLADRLDEVEGRHA